jgi:hypothetical protein
MRRDAFGGADAWRWIVQGWRLFRRQTFNWIMVALLFGGVVMILNLLPKIGSVIAAMLTPALLAGLLLAARDVESGARLIPPQLFRSFRNPRHLQQLLVVGFLPLLIGGTNWLLHFAGVSSNAVSIMTMGLSLVAMLAGLYAVPLIVLREESAGAALAGSLKLCATNPFAVAVFMALSLILGLLAALPFGLGLLVLIPVLACSIYESFEQLRKVTT